MKKLLKIIGIISLLLSVSSFAPSPNDWKIYFENETIKIESSLFSCDKPSDDIHNKYIILKVTNKTDKNIEVSFYQELWYNQICTTCTKMQEFETKINLQPNEVQKADCDSKTKELKIFESNSYSKKALSKFELTDIIINPKN
jgi:hypothetical protein